MPLSYNTFQGYAYNFVTTPANGVRDFSISLGANWAPLNVVLKHHRFKADFGSVVYGNETDLMIAYQVNQSLSLRAVFANFLADATSLRPSATRNHITLQYDF